MPENFLPSEIDDVVMHIVAEFRFTIRSMNATAENISNPDRFQFARVIESRDLARWNKHLQDFDRILERRRTKTA